MEKTYWRSVPVCTLILKCISDFNTLIIAKVNGNKGIDKPNDVNV